MFKLLACRPSFLSVLESNAENLCSPMPRASKLITEPEACLWDTPFHCRKAKKRCIKHWKNNLKVILFANCAYCYILYAPHINWQWFALLTGWQSNKSVPSCVYHYKVSLCPLVWFLEIFWIFDVPQLKHDNNLLLLCINQNQILAE